jgi:hypothetical protein
MRVPYHCMLVCPECEVKHKAEECYQEDIGSNDYWYECPDCQTEIHTRPKNDDDTDKWEWWQ